MYIFKCTTTILGIKIFFLLMKESVYRNVRIENISVGIHGNNIYVCGGGVFEIGMRNECP